MSRVEKVIEQWLNSVLSALSECEVIVAYSGGRDSQVLLHALCALKPNFPALQLRAVHINHGLQPLAPKWAEHCKHQAASLGVHCEIISVQINPVKGESIEEAARNARYSVFVAMLKSPHFLLTAHSEDDQAETVLLQLMRGAGPQGISAMRRSKQLGEGYHVRPLLAVSRKEIAAYALTHQLQWVDDPSNENLRFTRNFLRHEVLKPMQAAYPSAATCIARSASHVADMQALVNEYVLTDLVSCQDAKGMLKLNLLSHFSAKRQMAILKAWLNAHHIRSPSTRILQTILQQALSAKRDAKVSICFGNIALYRFQETLYWQSQTASLNVEPKIWDLSQVLSWGGNQYEASQVKGQGFAFAKEQRALLAVKLRKGGERCQLVGENMTRSLKKMFQTWQIPFWQRSTIPLFYQGDKLVCVGETMLFDGSQVGPDELGWVIRIVK